MERIMAVSPFFFLLFWSSVLAFPRPLPKSEKIAFVSGNEHKLREAQAILDLECFPWSLELISDVDFHEIQATQLEVAINKCKQAQKLVDGPVIVEDTSLVLNSLGGMPGVYIKDFWESIGNVGMIKLLDSFEDRSAYVQCTLCFARDSSASVKTFVGQTFGAITKEERGDLNFGWDAIFQPINCDHTFGEMTLDKKNMYSHRAKAFKQLQTYLNTRMGS